jgi:hypothetical protein
MWTHVYLWLDAAVGTARLHRRPACAIDSCIGDRCVAAACSPAAHRTHKSAAEGAGQGRQLEARSGRLKGVVGGGDVAICEMGSRPLG